jgi:NIPSNAP
MRPFERIEPVARPARRIRDHVPMRVLEIRTYRLLPNTRGEYHRLFVEEAAPLLAAHGIDVVRFGPSLDDPDGYVLLRSFADLADRERREEAFYSSPEWRDGPRAAVIEKIDEYLDAVLELDEAAIDALRAGAPGA